MRRKPKAVRVLALLLALWLAFPGSAAAKTIEEVQAEQERLSAEHQELEAQLATLRESEDKALEYQQALQQKIDLTEQKIDVSRESIQVMDREIVALEKKLELSKAEYEQTLDIFSRRVRALYMTGSISTLEILLSAESLTDFSMKAELLSATARHDQKLVQQIEEYLQKTQQDRERLQTMREEEAQVKRELEAAQEELGGLYDENQALIADLEDRKLMTQDTLAQNEEEDAALEAELQRLIEERNEEERRRKEAEEKAAANGGVVPPDPGSSSVNLRGDFAPGWPLPGIGSSHIIGNYGDIYNDGNMHYGMDIWADYGTPIVAAQAGQVLSAEFHYSWGNNVLLWHNETFSTRYAHCSSLAVYPGQYVEAGQIIGYVGSTGYSFGNHLHFEVYANGTRTDPRYYL